jgi:hypothetical protein
MQKLPWDTTMSIAGGMGAGLWQPVRIGANGAEFESFLFLLKAFWVFFDDSPLLTALAQELVAKVPEYMDTVNKTSAGQIFFGENEAESAAIGYGVLRKLAEHNRPDALFGFITPGDSAKMLDQFRAHYLEPFYEYFDEHLDDRLYVLHSLLRYKQTCEWFRREHLFDMANSDNEPIGYLIVFNMCDRPLRFLLNAASEAIPRVVYNHKTIFLLEIDIYPHAEPASKRGRPNPIDIAEEELTASPIES